MPNGLFGTRGLKLLCLVFMLIGCNPEKQWQLQETTGHLPDLRFSLMSDTGQAVTDQTYQGHLVMLFFSCTNCQAECTTALFRLTKIVQRYVTAFDAGHAIDLTGTDSDIENLAKRYRAAYRPKKPDSDDIVHSAAVYVFDTQGHARLLVTPDDTIETVANDLRHLLDSLRL